MRERNTARPDKGFELGGRCDQHLVPGRLEAERQSQIRLDVASGAEGVDCHSHVFAPEKCFSGKRHRVLRRALC